MLYFIHDSSPPKSDSLLHLLQQPSNGASWQATETSAVILFLCYSAKP